MGLKQKSTSPVQAKTVGKKSFAHFFKRNILIDPLLIKLTEGSYMRHLK
jgi:hypothetical protein